MITEEQASPTGIADSAVSEERSRSLSAKALLLVILGLLLAAWPVSAWLLNQDKLSVADWKLVPSEPPHYILKGEVENRLKIPVASVISIRTGKETLKMEVADVPAMSRRYFEMVLPREPAQLEVTARPTSWKLLAWFF